MWREFYESATLLDLPVMAMWLFMTTFAVVVVRAVLKKPTDEDTLKMLPLADDLVVEDGGRHD